MNLPKPTGGLTALLLAGTLYLTGCTSAGTATDSSPAGGSVAITNCGAAESFPAPAQRLFVNDSNLIAYLLALGAEDQVTAVSSVQRDRDILTRYYGDAVAKLDEVAPRYPSLETVIAARPDVMVAGWNYGYSESANLTPDTLAEHGIAAYVLSESCRQSNGARGTMNPWDAVRTDLHNLGTITGKQSRAADLVADLDRRLDALRQAPRAAEDPVVFVFDSGTEAIYTSGSFGAPHAVIEAAGGRNATADVPDTWVEVGWERLAAADPDLIVFVDYPGQTIDDKQKVLATNPATRTLAAVRDRRYLNLPYAMWTSGPLNIDAAEQVRSALERYSLIPADTTEPTRTPN
ncbi:ABC transporter substrate-binding protein [Nocardia grenadensis]